LIGVELKCHCWKKSLIEKFIKDCARKVQQVKLQKGKGIYDKTPCVTRRGVNSRAFYINIVGAQLLSQDGETHLEVYMKDGKCFMKPVKPEFVTILKMARRGNQEGFHIHISRWLQQYGLYGKRYELVWDGNNEWAELKEIEL
jgi:hypothetical protein